MEDTGRIRKPLSPSARRILFGSVGKKQRLEELWQTSYIDQAHLVMLAECGILDRERCAQLLRAIEQLQKENFKALEHLPAPRGLFLLYEDYLIATEGPSVGGMLQTARSRNDLNATLLKLRLRQPWLHLLEQVLRFHAVLLRRAERYANVVMPAYTHGQAAMPSSYGHYLAGIATALSRDLDGLLAIAHDLQSSPLGAGAVAGTSLPIRTDRTAQLLGFNSGPANSIDAVASRDTVLRLLASVSIYGLTLSRLATDLLLWATAEFGFLSLPDELTGSSSAMPQKKNPFLLEHVQGRSAALSAAFVQASSATHATPFTNSIAAGTEAVKPVWEALKNLTDMVVLIRLVVSGARPNEGAMLKRAVQGFTAATAVANQLVIRAKLDFRTAHKLIGAAVRKAAENSTELIDNHVCSSLAGQGIPISITDMDPVSVQRSQEFGGGPGPASLKLCLNSLRSRWATQITKKNSFKKQWDAAASILRGVAQEYSASDHDSLQSFREDVSNSKTRTIELRSDTFTLPSSQMMDAIAEATLGDDGYREDPTVIQLEELAAAKLGKEAACLTPSGTMANLAAILAHCKRGTRALVGDQSDIYAYEDQGLAEDAGVILSPVPTEADGTVLLSRLEHEFCDTGKAPVDLVCLENPHNLCGGVVLPLRYLRDAAALIHKKGARFHLDGARLFHAAVQLGCDPAEIARDADSVQICLSKGLAAPVGSIVAGSTDFIERVRNKRQMLGGNMRQAGIIAAPGIVALRHMLERLSDDHANARRFAEGLARIQGIEVNLSTVQTNTVVFRVIDPRFSTAGFIAAAEQFGVRVGDFRYGRLRAVFHYGIDGNDVDLALSIISGLLKGSTKPERALQEAHAHR